MTNGELKTLIRTILKEELAKLNEAPALDVRPTSNTAPKTVRSWSEQSLASELYESEAFDEAFAEDGWAFGNAVYNLVEQEVIAKYGKQTPEACDKLVTKVISHLRRFASNRDKDSDFFDWAADETITKIYKDTHDAYGNEY